MSQKRFSPKKNFKKTNVSKVAADKPILYKITNKKGGNIYTGIAKKGEGPDRLADHLPKGQDPVSGGKNFQIKKFDSIKDARKEEKKIIKNDQPAGNIQDK